SAQPAVAGAGRRRGPAHRRPTRRRASGAVPPDARVTAHFAGPAIEVGRGSPVRFDRDKKRVGRRTFSAVRTSTYHRPGTRGGPVAQVARPNSLNHMRNSGSHPTAGAYKLVTAGAYAGL